MVLLFTEQTNETQNDERKAMREQGGRDEQHEALTSEDTPLCLCTPVRDAAVS